MTNFIHLHTHSDFSFQDGAQSTDQIAEKAARLGMNAVALTDHGRAGGLVNLKKSCEKVGIKPIYGYEAYIAPESRLRKEKIDGFKPSSHLTLLAKNIEGLRNIFRLTSIGWLEGFYHKPRIDIEILEKHKEGLVVLGGCGSGYLSQEILADRPDIAIKRMHNLRRIFKDDFYIEIQNHGLDWQQRLLKDLLTLSVDSEIPSVITQDSHYTDRKDSDLHKYITRLAAGNLEFDSKEMYFKSREEMEEMFQCNPNDFGCMLPSLDRTQDIADKCNCEWEYGKTIWPVYDLPEGTTPQDRLVSLAEAGFKNKFGAGTKEYNDRLNYELKVINEMGFDTYFLVVADFINWAKNNNIPVGTGRGSAAGSLVCYCIGITGVDPIKYGLYFERFLNPARISLPDIDVDFCINGRDKVRQYVYEKYGPEKCAQIGTTSEFKPRGSLRNFARVMGYEPSVGDRLAALIPPDVAGKPQTFEKALKIEPKLSKTDYQDVIDMAIRAENLKDKAGVHAAGVVISDSEIITQVPLFKGRHDEAATQFDMHEIEEIGLVKYDFLGLRNLTVIKDTIKLIKEIHNIEVDIDTIDYEDQEVYKNIFQQGKLDGIFQFETSSGFRDLTIRAKPVNIEDLSAVTALFRPGPLGSGMTEDYIKRKNGESFEYLIPELEPVLEQTWGLMYFQESVMRLCTDIAGYTLSEADNMRKIIGKKLPDKMAKELEKFVSGCVKNGQTKEVGEELFEQIEKFSAYGFNKSHSVAYSIISFQTAWLKHYYKEEFYCALLNNVIKKTDRLIKYVYAIREEEIPILPPDVNRSNALFSLDSGTIIFGLAAVKGIGPQAVEKLIECRPREGYQSLEDLIITGVNKSTVAALAECGALEEITDLSRGQLVENIELIISHNKKLAKWEEREIRIAERNKEIELWNLNPEGPKPRKLPKSKKKPELPLVNGPSSLTRQDRLALENKTLGFYLTGHPLDDYDGLLRMAKYTLASLDSADNKEKINIPVVISSLIPKRTRNGKNMAVLIVGDKTGVHEATIFSKAWGKIKDEIEEEMICVLKGVVEKKELDDSDAPPIISIIVTDIKKVNSDTSLKMYPLSALLADGSKVEFFPSDEQNISTWQQALAFITNMKRMG